MQIRLGKLLFMWATLEYYSLIFLLKRSWLAECDIHVVCCLSNDILIIDHLLPGGCHRVIIQKSTPISTFSFFLPAGVHSHQFCISIHCQNVHKSPSVRLIDITTQLGWCFPAGPCERCEPWHSRAETVLTLVFPGCHTAESSQGPHSHPTDRYSNKSQVLSLTQYSLLKVREPKDFKFAIRV